LNVRETSVSKRDSRQDFFNNRPVARSGLLNVPVVDVPVTYQ
jgi:hypothetical protein